MSQDKGTYISTRVVKSRWSQVPTNSTLDSTSNELDAMVEQARSGAIVFPSYILELIFSKKLFLDMNKITNLYNKIKRVHC